MPAGRAGDPWFHKTLALGGLRLDTSQELFSAHRVDVGTGRLLRTLDGLPAESVLDVGCGYGAIGLALKAAGPSRTVHLVDRDALAVGFAKRNARANGLDVEVWGSLGYDDVAATYALVACNVPGKVSEPVLRHLLLDTRAVLEPDGLAAIVVVSAIAVVVERLLASGRARVLRRSEFPGHVVLHYTLERAEVPIRPALERAVYDRGRVSLAGYGVSLDVRTADGIPEFDTLGYETALVARLIASLPPDGPGHAVVVNPGQGHVPVLLWSACRPSSIRLTGRDLLALRYSHLNLLRAGAPADAVTLSHEAASPNAPPCDLLVVMLRDSEPPAASAAILREGARCLRPRGLALVAGSSTAVTRCLAALAGSHLVVRNRVRRRGHSAALLGMPRGTAPV